MTLQQENEVIDRVLAGEEAAYARLVDEYKRYAFTVALKVVGTRTEAEEAAQDAFIKAFNNLRNFNRQARFSTWLYRITFNTAISYKRKQRSDLVGIEAGEGLDSGEASGAEASDRKTFLMKAIARLNDADRLAIQMYYLKEFTLEEIAETTGINMNTLKVRVHRARQRLADELKRNLKSEALTL
jgi:RNA polymerase sigma-70 factor (ECF subfamily)